MFYKWFFSANICKLQKRHCWLDCLFCGFEIFARKKMLIKHWWNGAQGSISSIACFWKKHATLSKVQSVDQFNSSNARLNKQKQRSLFIKNFVLLSILLSYFSEQSLKKCVRSYWSHSKQATQRMFTRIRINIFFNLINCQTLC